ncbi:MAG: ATP-dependent sacrificial sulfur transferase LarE [Deltaproteobacteria bacterium]|nr:ATP-dependent sacrificial sulfur transferase LarE [Deltaproteobacteria bacterium]
MIRLCSILRDVRRALVAFSGGVDSSFLLRYAVDVLGRDSVLAVTVHSPLLPRGEAEEALELAHSWGVQVSSVQLDPLEDQGVARNMPDRCYLCKKIIFTHLSEMAKRKRISWILDGTNADDGGEYRPGIRALEELGIRSPLREAGLTKDQIRSESRRLGMSTWDRPSSPCLATRFPYGNPISLEAVGKVDGGEKYLKSLGFDVARIRVHGDVARVEVPVDRIGDLVREETREGIVSAFKEIGFRYITFDLQGFRSGSMDEVLPPVD